MGSSASMGAMRDRAVHLLSRLSFGPTEAEVARVLEMGEEAWLEDQLAPGKEQDERLLALMPEFQTLDFSTARMYDWLREPFDGRNDSELTSAERDLLQKRRRLPKAEMQRAVFARSVMSSRQLEAVLSDFWRNHFNVSYTKGGPADYLITEYDREVVRRHALGSFREMLLASTKHPAMLHYLDNHLSRRPPSKQELATIERRERRRTDSRERGEEAAQIAAQRGLNENYARELLELHTLGVDNVYKQKDVIAVAEALTGWTFDSGREGEWGFRFRPEMHVKGDKRVLGRKIREDNDNGGVGEGEEIIAMLAEHKGTAEFIATKLTRFFVSDRPSESIVKAVARVYRKEDGSIPDMVRAIVAHEDFWSPEAVRSKFRTPFEFLCASLRAVDAEVIDASRCLGALRDMGQPILHCDDPTGYYDTAESWLDPGVMATRWSFALDLATGKVKGVEIPVEFFDDLPQDVPRLWQHHLTKRLLPGGAGQRTRNALSTVTDEYLTMVKVPDSRELGPTLVGLLLGSPEFQQQ
jgi:uncharacterized protein (DUF1800 family)